MATCGSQSHRRALRAVAGVALAATVAAGCGPVRPLPTLDTKPPPALPAARKGAPPVLAVHFDRGKYPLLGSRVADLAKAGQAFNAVLISFGDSQLVREARGQRLKVYLGFDEHKEFAAGKDITADVRDLVRFAQAHRHEIAGIRVADRVNQGLTPEQTLDYLRATGGVLHREVPGVPVVVDLSDPQLTCGLPGQDRCDKPRLPDYRYQVDAELLRIYHSGDVDGFMLANGLARSDTDCGGCDVREVEAQGQGHVPAPVPAVRAGGDALLPAAQLSWQRRPGGPGDLRLRDDPAAGGRRRRRPLGLEPPVRRHRADLPRQERR